MNYLLLIQEDEKAWAQLSDEQTAPIMREYRALRDDLQASGHFVGGAQLHPSTSATLVKVRDGKPIVTDGPFAETREQIGGYFLIEAANLDEAIRIAQRIPSARTGTIEVRPVVSAPAATT